MKLGTYTVGNHKVVITKDTKIEDVKHLLKFESFVKAAEINVESKEGASKPVKGKSRKSNKSKQ